jgi:hypothetical protein
MRKFLSKLNFLVVFEEPVEGFDSGTETNFGPPEFADFFSPARNLHLGLLF